MRDLNDKVTGNELTADEFNDIPSELQNIIESAGITLSSGDLAQAIKAIATYSAAGAFFIDSGAADAYVLAPVGARVAPAAYSDGQRIEFIAANPNTGIAATVNLASLGAKSIKTQEGNDPAASAVSGRVRATYDAANDWFALDADISSVYASRDTVFTDSGAANSYVLSAVGEAPSAYFDGMIIRFRPANDNNGASTVNVAGLGVKTINNASTGFMKSGALVELEYDGTEFRILNTDRFISGDAGFVISSGVIEQWGATGDLGDAGAGQNKTTSAFLVPFPTSVDNIMLNGYGLASSSNAATCIVAVDDATTTNSVVGLIYHEPTASVQANWEIRWRAVGI